MKHFNLLKSILMVVCGTASVMGISQVTTYLYTGAPDSYIVPPGVSSIQVEVWGAQGQAITDEQYDQSTGGLGGYAIGQLAVTPGEVLSIYVGGTGTEAVAGFNGGALGGYGTPSDGDEGRAGSGGGASDVRQGGVALANRVIVGGGGGGGGRDYVNGTCQPCGTGGNGGVGGGIVGGNGADPDDAIYGYYFNPGAGGKGGTAATGGLGGDGPEGIDGNPGTFGNGGAGIDGFYSVASGGGGGGWYGGGAGAGVSTGSGKAGGGGAGGSSYIGGVTDGSTTPGVRLGNGQIIITILCNALTVTVSDYEICFGEDITLHAESESGADISWDAGVIDGVAFTPATSGTVIYTATSEDTEDCPAEIEIIVNEIPIVIAGADDGNFCIDEPIVLSAGGGADVFSWDPTDLEPGIGSHTYTLTGVNSTTGCVNTDEVVVTVHALPIVSGTVDHAVICEGLPVAVSGTGASTYVWSPAGILNGVNFVPGAPGTYTYNVVGTDGFGCSNTGSVIVTVVEDIAISYTVTDEVAGLDGAIDITVTGGVSPYTYDWNNDGTGDFDDTEDLTGLSDGFYSVVVNGAAGCSTTQLIYLGSQAGIEGLEESNVLIYPNPTTAVVTLIVKGNFTYELSAINGDVLLNGSAVNQEILDLTEMASGIYFVTLKDSDSSTTVKLVKQ